MGRDPDDDAGLVAMIDGGQSIRLGRRARSRPVHAAIAALLACAAAASPSAAATPSVGGTLPDPSEAVDTVTKAVEEPVQQVVAPLPDTVGETVETVIEPVPDPVKQPLEDVIERAPVVETVKDPVKTVTDHVAPPRDPPPARDARPSPAGAAPATTGRRRPPGPADARRRQPARSGRPRASGERPGRRSRTRETRRARGAESPAPADRARAPQPVARRSAEDAERVSASPAGGGVLELVRPVLERTAFPLFLLGLVAAFLVIQGRIDRRDPKLALARVEGDADLAFPEPGTVG
jgi:hypothetical protein